MDTIVFDIETKNFFTDPEVGWNNYDAIEISVVGVYSYLKDRYVCFDENEMVQLGELFRNARTIVGFSSNRYDVPVLNAHFKALKETRDIDLWKMDRIDLLDEIEMASGARISLSKLAKANLGTPKTKSGAEAITLYREGKIEELKNYCLEDVRLTKELYDIYKNKRYFMIPDKLTGKLMKLNFTSGSDQGKLL